MGWESETFWVYFADQLTPSQKSKTRKKETPKTKQHLLEKEKKHKGERQHHRKEAEEGSTTQKQRGKVLFK